MSILTKYFDLSNIRGDIMGGLTAGVVALPLALAFGEASGAGPIAGLWGAIFVGFFAALLGGTGSQISGPTGPMVVVFAGVFASLPPLLALCPRRPLKFGQRISVQHFRYLPSRHKSWSAHQPSACKVL